MVNIFTTLDLPCITQIADNLNDDDFISFTESCKFIHNTFRNNTNYLAARCQRSFERYLWHEHLNEMRDYGNFNPHLSNSIFRTVPWYMFEINGNKFGTGELFENIFNIAFLNLSQFPWKWFLSNLSHGNFVFDLYNGHDIGFVVGDKQYFDELDEQTSQYKKRIYARETRINQSCNKVMYISRTLVNIGIQISDSIVGLRISNEEFVCDYNICLCKDPQKLIMDKNGKMFDVFWYNRIALLFRQKQIKYNS